MKNVNIGLVGLGQIGIYLYNELQKKRKDIELKNKANEELSKIFYNDAKKIGKF